MALNPSTISYLLQALGPLPIPDYHETLTAANAVDRLEYYVHNRTGAASDPNRKRFLVEVVHAVLQRLTAMHGDTPVAVLDDLVSALDDRSMMIAVTDTTFAGGLRQAHWDGGLRTDAGDYLGVFDQNVGDSKLNPYVDQAVTYDVTRQADGSLAVRVTIAYRDHVTHPETWIARPYYQDYLRIAVPGGVTAIDQSGYDDTFWPDELSRGRHLIAGGLTVPAGSSRAIAATYVVPARDSGASAYSLLVQKQSGSRPWSLTVRVHDAGRTWSASLTLRHDVRLSVPWSAPSGPLRVQNAMPD